MELKEAIDLIRPGVAPATRTWVDLGAGSGVFTKALAKLLGRPGKVFAVDRDAAALAALRRETRDLPPDWAQVVVVEGDFSDIPALAWATRASPGGVLLGNALHFAPDPVSILTAIRTWLGPAGRIIVVEYDGRPANPWVPHPVPVKALDTLAAQAGLGAPRVIGERPSAYGGTLYCAVLDVS